MKIVQFIKPLEMYALDDVAAFDDRTADKLVEKGFALEVEPEAPKDDDKANVQTEK